MPQAPHAHVGSQYCVRSWRPHAPQACVSSIDVPGVQPPTPLHGPHAPHAPQLHIGSHVRVRSCVPAPHPPQLCDWRSVAPGVHPVAPAQVPHVPHVPHAHVEPHVRLRLCDPVPQLPHA